MFIQSLERFNNESSIIKRFSTEADSNYDMIVHARTHRNYSTLASKSQSKRKKILNFVSGKRTVENDMPEKNIFTSKGIIESTHLENSNKKITLKNQYKYKRREKCTSICNNLVFNPNNIVRSKTPKILIKSVFNFSKNERTNTGSLDRKEQATYYKRSPRKLVLNQIIFSGRKRFQRLKTLQKNDFVGWETEGLNDYEYNL